MANLANQPIQVSSLMKVMEQVLTFNDKFKIDLSPPFRMLDIVSEFGEVIEIVKKPNESEKTREEFGDLIYSVCSLIGRKIIIAETAASDRPDVEQIQIDLGILAKQVLSDSEYGKLPSSSTSDQAIELAVKLLLKITNLASFYKIDSEGSVDYALNKYAKRYLSFGNLSSNTIRND